MQERRVNSWLKSLERRLLSVPRLTSTMARLCWRLQDWRLEFLVTLIQMESLRRNLKTMMMKRKERRKVVMMKRKMKTRRMLMKRSLVRRLSQRR